MNDARHRPPGLCVSDPTHEWAKSEVDQKVHNIGPQPGPGRTETLAADEILSTPPR